MSQINKVLIVAHVPRALEETFLLHLRAFDRAHPGCHFEVAIDHFHKDDEAVVDRVRKAAHRLGLPVFGFVKDHREAGS